MWPDPMGALIVPAMESLAWSPLTPTGAVNKFARRFLHRTFHVGNLVAARSLAMTALGTDCPFTAAEKFVSYQG